MGAEDVAVLSDLPHLRDLLPRTTGTGSMLAETVAQVATPAELMDADLPLIRLERAFRSRHLACVAVQGPAEEAVGLVTRTRFLAAVAGDLGFGRALLTRATVAEVTDWAPLVLAPRTGVVEASLLLTSRTEDRRFDPVLVRAAQWGVVSPTDLVRALAGHLAVRTLRDAATGVGTLELARLELADRTRRATGTAHRVALVLVRLEGLDAMRDARGDDAAEGVVAEAAAHLRALAPPGWTPARTGAQELALVGGVPGPVDTGTAVAGLDAVQDALASFPVPHAGAVRWRSTAVCSPAGGAAFETLLTAARRRLSPPDVAVAR